MDTTILFYLDYLIGLEYLAWAQNPGADWQEIRAVQQTRGQPLQIGCFMIQPPTGGCAIRSIKRENLKPFVQVILQVIEAQLFAEFLKARMLIN